MGWGGGMAGVRSAISRLGVAIRLGFYKVDALCLLAGQQP